MAFPAASNGASPSLMRWAARQRTLFRQGSLPAEIIEELDSVCFVWDPLQAAWDRSYEGLETFYEEHGHCNVPRDYAEDPALARWVDRQRVLYRKGQLHPQRREALVLLDFIFDPQAARWEERLTEYAAAATAATAQSQGSPPQIPEVLRRWAARQRKAHASGNLANERIEALNQLGTHWQWTPPAARRPNALRRLGLRLAREASLGGGDGSGGGSVVTGDGRGVSAAAAAGAGSCYARCASVGRALVISVGARREHAAAELTDAREALRALGYTVTTVTNPTASELSASLIAHATQRGWEAHASSVIALMAHGRDASLECQDGRRVPLRRLFGLLAPAAAPALQGKPKVFLIQACRRGEAPVLEHAGGGAGSGELGGTASGEPPCATSDVQSGRTAGAVDDDSGVCTDDSSRKGECPSAVATHPLCEEHDFLWGYAATAGTVAYRGALFAALREVVDEHGCEASWLELLQHANERLCAWSALRPVAQPLPSMEIRSTCRGPVFAPSDLVIAEAAEDVEGATAVSLDGSGARCAVSQPFDV